jgi:methylglutaconyl-CoA hydratase
MNRASARNALSKLLIEQFQEAMQTHANASCIILRSSQPGMFCAGADLKERKGMTKEEGEDFVRKLRLTFTMLE